MTHFELAMQIAVLVRANAPCGVVIVESEVGGTQSLVRLRARARGELRECKVRIDDLATFAAVDDPSDVTRWAEAIVSALRREIERGEDK